MNLIDRVEASVQEGISRMYEALSADDGWDVYNCYFKLEYAESLELKPGDNQKFE